MPGQRRHSKLNQKTTAILIGMDTMREHGKWGSRVFPRRPFPSTWLDVKWDKFLSISCVNFVTVLNVGSNLLLHHPTLTLTLTGMRQLCPQTLIYCWLCVCVCAHTEFSHFYKHNRHAWMWGHRQPHWPAHILTVHLSERQEIGAKESKEAENKEGHSCENHFLSQLILTLILLTYAFIWKDKDMFYKKN